MGRTKGSKNKPKGKPARRLTKAVRKVVIRREKARIASGEIEKSTILDNGSGALDKASRGYHNRRRKATSEGGHWKEHKAVCPFCKRPLVLFDPMLNMSAYACYKCPENGEHDLIVYCFPTVSL